MFYIFQPRMKFPFYKNIKISVLVKWLLNIYFSSPDCYDLLGTNAQMNPPIRKMDPAKACGMELKKVVDVIGSDHAPKIEEKKKKYPLSPSGMTGVQHFFP